MTNIEAFAAARKKARYGHKAQIVWKDQSGEFHFGERSPATIKAALLAVGTKGRFTELSERNIKFVCNWFMGCRMIRNAKFGC